MAKCLRCEHELEEIEIEDVFSDDDEIKFKEYKCPYCGTLYRVEEILEEEKHTVPKYNKELEKDFIDQSHGYEGLCTECGKHIIWSSDFMRSEVLSDVGKYNEETNKFEYDKEDDSLVSYVYCPYCGSMIEIIEPKPSELINYPIHNELKEK